MRFNAPLNALHASRLVELLALPPGARVVDAGCGRASLLIDLVERAGATGLGLDRDEAALAPGRAEAATRGLAERVTLRVADLRAETLAEGFDAALCVGATHAFAPGEAAWPAALQALAAAVKPGGLLLMGEAFWRRPPEPDYLALLGSEPGVYRDHADNVAAAEAVGLLPLYATTSADDEWDDFEWSHHLRIEAEARARPDDPDAAAGLARSLAWRRAYLRWGRTTMGFGFYLLRRPEV